ncbi:MAG: ribose 5-phosphate isomerase B [Bacteroidota bacterium]|nr:ribose 5-phosphate isomerase B [Bacteroidota bacterium]
MKVAIGSDHAGFLLKEKLKAYLQEKGFKVIDFGAYSEERADYPDFAHPVAKSVEIKEVDFGLIMCGTGNGINMAANKHKGIRAALCWNPEIAALARQHNDANVLTLPARCITEEEAIKIVDVFFSTAFEGGRHTERVNKISVFA